MLELIHILIIVAVSIMCYMLFFKQKIINDKVENFNSENINLHSGDDYNVVSYNYNLEDNNDNDN